MKNTKFITRHLTKIPKTVPEAPSKKPVQLYCTGDYIEHYIPDNHYDRVVGWWLPAAILFFSGVLAILSSIKENYYGNMPYYLSLAGLSFLWGAYILRVHLKGQFPTRVLFVRKTGMVQFGWHEHHPPYEISFADLELYCFRGSSWGGSYFLNYLVPTRVPDEINLKILYVAYFPFGTFEDAQRYWSAVSQFMDKNYPIPRSLYYCMEHALNNSTLPGPGGDPFPEHLAAQAPFFNFETKEPYDKEIW